MLQSSNINMNLILPLQHSSVNVVTSITVTPSCGIRPCLEVEVMDINRLVEIANECDTLCSSSVPLVLLCDVITVHSFNLPYVTMLPQLSTDAEKLLRGVTVIRI